MSHYNGKISNMDLQTRRILVNVRSDDKIGMGHVYNILTILPRFKNDDILIVMKRDSSLGMVKFVARSYNTAMYEDEREFFCIIKEFSPDIVFNDILDTKVSFVKKLRRMNCFVVNFEDLGAGSDRANLVFNPIYFQQSTTTKFFGEEYACVREEFRETRTKTRKKTIVVTFGGTDPRRLTLRLLRIFEKHKPKYGIVVIIGDGFRHKNLVIKSIKRMQEAGIKVEGVIKTDRILKYVDKSMFAITANGRTVFEVASRGIPMITISANLREEKHEFTRTKMVGYHLGLHSAISDEDIIKTIKDMELEKNRKTFEGRLKRIDLKSPLRTVEKIINRSYKQWKLDGKRL